MPGLSRLTSLRFPFVALGLLLTGALLYPFAFQVREAVRFELGSMDWDYLLDPSDVSERIRMEGPIRSPDGSVEFIDFYGRLTRRRVGFRLPYHAFDSPIHLRIRCHRFGLEGIVHVRVNGESIDRFVFTERSYPWGGIEAVIPQSIAEEGPLTIELETEGGLVPPAHLPEDLGLGIDWFELTPLSGGVKLRPGLATVGFALLFPLAGALFARATGASPRAGNAVLAVLMLAVLLLTRLAPFSTAMALQRLWVVFPLGALLYFGLTWCFRDRFRPRLVSGEASFLSRVFVVACLVHSVLIFFPNHAPPDLWNHLPQVDWLSELALDFDSWYRFSSSSDPFDDQHVRPHFGVEYGAPYPPFFYVLTFAASQLQDDRRFLIEFISVVVSAAMMVPLFLLARIAFEDPRVARFAALLVALEISIWHHAHRVHGPGSLGHLVVLFWITYLAANYHRLDRRRPFAWFAALSAAAALSYAASLFHVSILVSVLLLFPWRWERPDWLGRRIALGFGIGLSASFLLYYGPYALAAVQKASLLLDRASYDPPATFYFLRNQMRDTVRILSNGYFFFVALSLGGFWLLRSSAPQAFHRRLFAAWGATYVLMLLLKDPVFFPMLFLHAKEDLFYATLACLLGGLLLAHLWERALWGRVVVAGILLIAVVLGVRDQVWNHDTLHDGERALRSGEAG